MGHVIAVNIYGGLPNYKVSTWFARSNQKQPEALDAFTRISPAISNDPVKKKQSFVRRKLQVIVKGKKKELAHQRGQF